MQKDVKELTQKLQKNKKDLSIKKLFKTDPDRFSRFSKQAEELHLLYDYSRNLIDKEIFDGLMDIAEAARINDYAQRMFAGEKINWTEDRAVLHTALRDFSGGKIEVDGQDVMPEIVKAREKMKVFSEKVRSGEFKGSTGKKISTVVNIGIGGSDLGPRMAALALRAFSDGPRPVFVSNVDAADIIESLKGLDPETTLFLVASKTFTTQETITNALSARSWLTSALGEDAVEKHFVALSTNREEVERFGIDPENMFGFWDFVGGRYSLWSSIGLSLAISIGYENFESMLRGAEALDKHFLETEYSENIPVIMALIGFLYNNVYGFDTTAILPYSQYLERFPAYLQQGDMESNGKSVNRSGGPVDYHTGQIIWGEPGTNSQHSFFQLLHQGSRIIPADFIGYINPPERKGDHHDKLMANMFAQGEALAFGCTKEEAKKEMQDAGLSKEDIDMLLPHKVFRGNRPSSTLLFEELTPYTLGVLIALYEQKIFVQGILWDINSFDQWGVELGKKLASRILKKIGDAEVEGLDSSTSGLLAAYIKGKEI
ncbi:MAG: glucose-6-phosphate isomerase [Elusimicrobia bacterium]|nr:glucose-6-phosphate isomerase [Elusimicrobiota bacterium]